MTARDTRPAARPDSSFARGWTVARVRGVPVRLDLSWLVICGLVVYIFWTRFAALLTPYTTPSVVVTAVVATALFFLSIVAHELGHAVTSLEKGIPVASVTLFLLGGVTESAREPDRARDEAVIVGSGPFISLVLAAAFGLLFAIRPTTNPYGVVTGYLAWMNLALAVFNVVPAYPLDGGRLLRAVLWGLSGRRHAATRWAARIGQVFAAVLIVGGLNGVLGGPLPAPDGALSYLVLLLAANGLWSVLVGVFLLRGALGAHRQARAREQLARLSIADTMGTLPTALPSDLPLDEAASRMAARPSVLWPVGQPLAGGVTLSDLDAVPKGQWRGTVLGDIAIAAEEVTVDMRTPFDIALQRLRAAPRQMLIVTDGGRPVGLLTASLVGGLTQ